MHFKPEIQSRVMPVLVKFFSLFCVALISLSSQALAQSSEGTGLPVPRFVSLKSEKVNMRIGPGKQFQVVWRYEKKGLPVEIIQEYDNWRKVRDPEGDEGWILHSLLSGRRTAIIDPGERGNADAVVPIYSSAQSQETPVAKVEPGVVTQVLACQKDWCQISADGNEGFVEKKLIWGVYPDELIER